MDSWLPIVMIIFVVLFAIALPTVISDVSEWMPLRKLEREKKVKKEF